MTVPRNGSVLSGDGLRETQDDDLDAVRLALQIERAALQPGVEPRCTGSGRRDEDLARAGNGPESRRHIDDVAHRGELRVVFLADRADVRDPRIDADSHWH